ncbi:uncharacterized protein LOC113304077 [Papaver somniferum]|uniref:uncharacterized protein LOC113304077 n=1 Tax=Papaver somniferum TaxID=3469 RepID=UPI000E705A62|nr:uncharacterized protein LOC113304077 [Papaver somniferum]
MGRQRRGGSPMPICDPVRNLMRQQDLICNLGTKEKVEYVNLCFRWIKVDSKEVSGVDAKFFIALSVRYLRMHVVRTFYLSAGYDLDRVIIEVAKRDSCMDKLNNPYGVTSTITTE